MEPLKNMFNSVFLEQVASVASATLKGFDKAQFLKEVFADGWEQLELKQRIRRISTVLHAQMSGDYAVDIELLLTLTKALHKHAGRDDTFVYMFLPDYIEQYGTDHVHASLAAMEQVTVLSSCEYAIRPFIIKYQEASIAKMQEWCVHPHASVRRLASEGCRPRLPWGMALPAFKKTPSAILPILESLKNDSSEFVRKSVANNLNDIAKDNPAVVLEIARKWKGISKNVDWIIKHGCRTLLKKADSDTLKIFGLVVAPPCSVHNFKLAANKIRVGEYLHFSFSLVNEAEKAAVLRVEYVITYAKANDKQSRKVFKITENTYQPGQAVLFSRKQSFANMTTRKHYAGIHKIAIAINGTEKTEMEFDVIDVI